VDNPHKLGSGLQRVVGATRNSLAGLAAALRYEAAFRHLALLALLLVPSGLWLGKTGAERALLVGTALLPLVAELLNAAIEAAVDRISLERHPLAGRAKDLGSAAVMLALVIAAAAWVLILLDH
jgi:diacylglycerol kinase (ATP)